MNKEESIRTMKSKGRDIITPSHAIDIVEPWGMPVDDIPIEHWNAGADLNKRTMIWETGTGVSVKDLVPAIVKYAGLTPDYYTDKIGRGSGAADITFKNCVILEESL